MEDKNMETVERKNREPGDKLPGGKTIKILIRETDKVGVYITTDNLIGYQWFANQGIPDYLQPAFGKTASLSYTISNYLPKKKREGSCFRLAHALCSALHGSEGSDLSIHFSDVEKAILKMAEVCACFRYLVGSTIASVLLVAAMYLIHRLDYANIDTLLYGALGGTVGATISVLLRVRDLSIENIAPLWFAIIQGCSRTILGALFGIVLIVTIKAQMIFAFAQNNLYAITLLATVAGFSERFAPELLKSIEDKQKSQQEPSRP